MMIEINGREYYIDGWLYQNIQVGSTMLRNDWDLLGLIDGVEGSGKSNIGQTVAAAQDPTIAEDPDRVCMNLEELETQILKAKKYESIIYDEAFISSRAALSAINQKIIKLFGQIRQKNLFILLILPSFFELEKYLAIHRSRFLIHVYTGDNFERGYFSFFNFQKKKDLYLTGKKFYQYTVLPNFRGRFTKGYVLNDDVYRAKKLNSLTNYEDKSINNKHLKQRNALITYLNNDLKMTGKNIADIITRYSRTSINEDTVNKAVIKSLS